MRFFNKLKSTQKALSAVAATLFFSLSSPVMASEVPVDSLLNTMINSAIESTKDQLTDAIEHTLQSTQLFEDVEIANEQLVVLNAKPGLSVDTTAAE